MAIVDFTPYEVTTRGDHCHIITWSGMANGDGGAPIQMPGSADRSVQVVGTFGSGGVVRIEGSNDGANYAVLRDAVGDDLNFSSAGIEMVAEVTRYMRPRVISGDGSTNVTIAMLVRRPAR